MDDSEQLRRVVEMYKSMPELWNTKDRNYKNKASRRSCYDKLLKEFQKIKKDATVDDVKKRIANMRTCYRRDLKKYLRSEKARPADVYVSRLWYFDALDFLRDVEMPLHGRSNLSSDGEEAEDAASNSQMSKKFKKDTPSNMRMEFLKKATEHLESSKSKDQDEAAIYASGWACMYRQMNVEQQLYAKQAVDEIMLLGRFNKLHYDYLHSNPDEELPTACAPYESRVSTPISSSVDSMQFTAAPTNKPLSNAEELVQVKEEETTLEDVQITPVQLYASQMHNKVRYQT